jgi:acid phosphatase type 7
LCAQVSPGNHEADGGWDTPKQPFAPFFHRFHMSYAESRSTANNSMWYSWNYGSLVHFVSMNTETDFPGAPEGQSLFGDQLTWLRQDLAAAKASGVQHIIVLGHRPIYSSAQGYSVNGIPQGDCAALQTAVEELLKEFGASLMIVGHQHAYERTFPVFQNQPTSTDYHSPAGITHLVVGGTGCEEGIAASWVDWPSWLAHRYPEKITEDEPGWGYGIMQFFPDRIVWVYYRVDNTGVEEIEDTFTLWTNASA